MNSVAVSLILTVCAVVSREAFTRPFFFDTLEDLLGPLTLFQAILIVSFLGAIFPITWAVWLVNRALRAAGL